MWYFQQRKIRAAVDSKGDKRLTVTDGHNGTYAVAFELKEAGTHKFHVTISGQAIQDSPYVVSLKGSSPPAPPIVR